MADKLGRHPLPVIRNRYFLLADLVLLPLSVALSYTLRLGAARAWILMATVVAFAAVATLLKPIVFYYFGIYRYHWRYASISELVVLASAVCLGEIGTLLVAGLLNLVLPLRREGLPAVLIIDWLISFILVGGVRLIPRLLIERPLLRPYRNGSAPVKSGGHRVLVMGAGHAGAMIIREMLANPGLGFVPIGLLDDDLAKEGMVIHGVPVLGSRDAITSLAQRKAMDEVIIAMPTAPGRAIREVVALCHQAEIPYRTMPGLHELISGRVAVKQVREVRIEDLLRRDPVRFLPEQMPSYLTGEIVLVTGAGGSIGSELCRQIGPQGPAALLLLGHGENSIYQIAAELRAKHPQLTLVPLIADVRDRERLRSIFETCHPTVVFHAAAHKHVPLMESNVPEAVTNNVFGTRTLLEVSEAYSVKRFVLVSSDKAVNPTTVMGVTKRIAELLTRAAAERSQRPFVVVRFGNVLGSRGSVVPLFQQQIAQGGPITVTHPDMRRYFMTIPEAAHLILQAGALGSGGEIFVLDMGEPISIAELANDLIRLSGLEPGRDIEVCFTEPRAGEKLDEALFRADEEIRATENAKILVAHGSNGLDDESLSAQLAALWELARTGDSPSLTEQMQQIIPEYEPSQEALDLIL